MQTRIISKEVLKECYYELVPYLGSLQLDSLEDVLLDLNSLIHSSTKDTELSWIEGNTNDCGIINSKLRNTLRHIMNSETADKKEFYDSVYAVLLVLARYWPTNEYVYEEEEQGRGYFLGFIYCDLIKTEEDRVSISSGTQYTVAEVKELLRLNAQNPLDRDQYSKRDAYMMRDKAKLPQPLQEVSPVILPEPEQQPDTWTDYCVLAGLAITTFIVLSFDFILGTIPLLIEPILIAASPALHLAILSAVVILPSLTGWLVGSTLDYFYPAQPVAPEVVAAPAAAPIIVAPKEKVDALFAAIEKANNSTLQVSHALNIKPSSISIPGEDEQKAEVAVNINVHNDLNSSPAYNNSPRPI